MNDVTRILAAVESGTPGATDELFPLVYEELRSIARRQLATEQPGATLQATALVHEAYLRLVGNGNDSSWSHRGHFFGAAAQAMRRILVDVARQKAAQKRNDRRERQELKESSIAAPMRPEYVLAVDEALDRLEATHPEAARLVQLRYFAGFTNKEAAEMLGISPRKADQIWAYARVWLAAELGEDAGPGT